MSSLCSQKPQHSRSSNRESSQRFNIQFYSVVGKKRKKNVLEASRGLMEVVVVVVAAAVVRGERRTREEGFEGSRLKTTLQCSATFAVTAEREEVAFFFSLFPLFTVPQKPPPSTPEPVRAFCCHHRPWMAFRRCFCLCLDVN